MDGFILATFLILAAGVVLAVVMEDIAREKRRLLGLQIDRICRWAFPLTYAITTVVLSSLFFVMY